jgi:hypothetical protein
VNRAVATITPLPRELIYDGHLFVEVYRQQSRGGATVYLKNSPPDQVVGHEFYVFQIDVVNGREQLGKQLAIRRTLNRAINVATKAKRYR